MISRSRSTCSECGRPGEALPHLLMSNPPQQPYVCSNAECRYTWNESVGTPGFAVSLPPSGSRIVFDPSVGSVGPAPGPAHIEWGQGQALPKTPAEKALERDEERREARFQMEVEAHKLYVESTRQQMELAEAQRTHGVFLRDHMARQTEALEGMLTLLRKVQEDHARESGMDLP